MSNETSQLGALPYGPATLRIRKFLQRLAAFAPATEADVVARFSELSASRDFRAAELALGIAIERSGRESAQTALAGPLLQLVRSPAANANSTLTDDDVALRPIAEPALAALLGVMMSDVLTAQEFAPLYEAFAMAIPLSTLS